MNFKLQHMLLDNQMKLKLMLESLVICLENWNLKMLKKKPRKPQLKKKSLKWRQKLPPSKKNLMKKLKRLMV